MKSGIINRISSAAASGAAGGNLSGTYPNPTVAKVNGVAYPSAPSTHTVPVVSASNTVTYTALGNGISDATGSLDTTFTVNAQTGTTYTIATTDAAKLVTFNNTSAIAVTLPVATTTGFGAGFSLTVYNRNTGTVTITPTTSTINGGTTLVLQKDEGAQITSNGLNYLISSSTIKVPLQGTYANAPASPTTGQMYFATDLGSGVMMIYNGSKWKPLGGRAIIYQHGEATSTTTSSGETNLVTVTVPAGLLSAQGAIFITGLGVGTGTTNTKNFRIRASATSGDVGAGGGTLYGDIQTTASQLSLTFKKEIFNRNSVSSQVGGQAGNTGAAQSTATLTTSSIATGTVWYLNFNALCANNSTDTAGFGAIAIEWVEA